MAAGDSTAIRYAYSARRCSATISSLRQFRQIVLSRSSRWVASQQATSTGAAHHR
ncbi:hypothetical protein ACQP2F_24585 [Actinoplanes sp. CA-030573]|uniref:hypothetical protein n=1 Tax=Actinoplanes sp. CA-030573 TaxID=3239898 RepID=UPI003D8EC65A